MSISITTRKKEGPVGKITIGTVAKAAQVSVKTVSRVLNHETPMRTSTREKVLKVIKELGYKPSMAAVALAGRQSKIIGLVYSNSRASYVMSLQNGVLNTCAKEAYNLVIHPILLESKLLVQEIVSFAKNSHLDGVIIPPPLCDKEGLLEALLSAGINVVTISPRERSSKVSSVSCVDKDAVERMISMLIESGHQDIGFIKGPECHGVSHQRFLGYLSALKKAGLKLDESLLKEGDFTFESGKLAAHALLTETRKPTAIFASNDYMAAGVISTACDLGMKIPDELSVIGFDNAPVAGQIFPSLSTIKQPIEAMAESATQLLIAKNKDHATKTQHIDFVADLVLRDSHTHYD